MKTFTLLSFLAQHLTLSIALPCDNDNASYVTLLPKVDHPNRHLCVVIVNDGTFGKQGILDSIYSQGSMSILPVLPEVTLVIGPNFLLVCQILNWKQDQ